MSINRPIVVIQVPERLDLKEVSVFALELEPLLEGHRPRIVLDCSHVRYIDSAGVEMLLHWLDEAMKRNGDLKLADVSAELAVILELMRVDRVFEISGTCQEAVRSFNVVPLEDFKDTPWYSTLFRDLGTVKQAG